MLPRVSIIIPAHNAAATLDDTLRSVCAQTYPHWEAIVVENGSTDTTAAGAGEWAAREPRIRVAESVPGVSNARNAGLKLARHAWILFLDSDDWILPTHLERLTARLAADSTLDCVHGGWRRIGPDGTVLIEEYGPPETDLFPRFARTCAFTIHCGITRRTLIEAAGGFDPTLRTCEDWDLWQRIARMGCRFGAVREALACYRTRPGSASMNAAQLVSDGRKVIERGYSADPRLAAPREEYAEGLKDDDQGATLLYTVAWAAGLAVGGGIDATPLLDLVDPTPGVTLDSSGVAGCIFCCAMLPAALPTSAWAEQFSRVDPLLSRFLEALESRIRQKGLARSTSLHLTRMAMDISPRPRPFTVGRVHAVRVDVTAAIPDLELPETVERLHCVVVIADQPLGILELPVIDGAMPAEVLADAIAAEYAWPILERFFARSVYPSLHTAKDEDGWSVQRGEHTLASGLAGNGTLSWTVAHEHIGWTIFLQEVWGAPGLLDADFYASTPDRVAPENALRPPIGSDWITVEISDSLPPALVIEPGTMAVLTVGGVPVAQAALTSDTQTISAGALRAALNNEAGYELCRACVREGLLGSSFEDPTPLRARLAARAAEQRAGSLPSVERDGIRLLPQVAARLPLANSPGDAPTVLPRSRGACGTAISRRALLPRALWPEIAAARASRNEPVVGPVTPTPAPARVIYAPELFWRPAKSLAATAPASAGRADTRLYGAAFFEELFHSGADPWHYETPYEKKKYEQTLELLPQPRFRRALELACAEGHFTRLLAPRADRLLATDFSPTALRRAAARCQEHRNIEFAPLDLVRDAFPSGRFDLIVCSEVLYYTDSLANLRRVAAKIADALEPGGYLVTAHAHLVADEPHRAGFDWDLPFGAKRIGETLGRDPRLKLVRELRTPLYRIQVFQRQLRVRKWLSRRRPSRILLPQPTELPPHAAAHAQWRGGVPQRFQPPETARTSRLPILMYHRVAPVGPGSMARYRVTPDSFLAQLQWLASQNYRCVSLDEWRRALLARRPLVGRCVALTFDDGFLDFRDFAWPLLQRFGFSATVFLPTGFLGDQNRWDQHLGDTVPLLSWSDIRQLRNEGVEFGSHSVTHPALTSLSPTEIAAEALRSRITIEERLAAPVSAFAYPYGEVDRVVESVTGACGYTFGLTCEERPSELVDRLTALPRLEVRGEMSLRDFEELVTST